MATLSDSQIAGLAKAAGFPDDQIAIAVAVALGESGGRSDAFNGANSNGSWDAGIWQINSIHGYSKEHLFNPQNNAAAAFKIWKAAGNRWTPWVVYNRGTYRVYLARGRAAAGNPTKTINTGGSGRRNATGDSDNGEFDSPGFLERVTDASTWQRIGLFLLGGILMLYGLYQMTGVGDLAIKTAKGIVTARGLKL